MCVLSVWDSGCLWERGDRKERGENVRREQPRVSDVTALWSSLRKGRRFEFFFPSPVLHTHGSLPSQCICAQHDVHLLVWNGCRVERRRQEVTGDNGEEGRVNSVTSKWGGDVVLMSQQEWLHEEVMKWLMCWTLSLLIQLDMKSTASLYIYRLKEYRLFGKYAYLLYCRELDDDW